MDGCYYSMAGLISAIPDEVGEVPMHNISLVRSCGVVILAAALFAAPGCEDEGGSPPPNEGTSDPASVELRLVNGLLPLVRVLIDDTVSLDMLVDTGSTATVLPESLFGSGRVSVRSLQFENGVGLADLSLRTSDSPFTLGTPGYINGILGLDVLGRFDISIDYHQCRLYFEDIQADGDPDRHTVDCVWDGDRLAVTAQAGDQVRSPVVLDTGSSHVRFGTDALAAMTPAPTWLYEAAVFTSVGVEPTAVVMLPDFRVGTAATGPIVALDADWRVVGGSFFRNFLVTFLFDEALLKLTPAPGDFAPDYIRRVGLQIHFADAHVIARVLPGSPADHAAVDETDQLETINGAAVDQLGYLGVVEALANPETTLYELVLLAPGHPPRITHITLAP